MGNQSNPFDTSFQSLRSVRCFSALVCYELVHRQLCRRLYSSLTTPPKTDRDLVGVPADEVKMYKIPFYMEAELEQMQAAAPAEKQQQPPPGGQPGAVKVITRNERTSKIQNLTRERFYTLRQQMAIAAVNRWMTFHCCVCSTSVAVRDLRA